MHETEKEHAATPLRMERIRALSHAPRLLGRPHVGEARYLVADGSTLITAADDGSVCFWSSGLPGPIEQAVVGPVLGMCVVAGRLVVVGSREVVIYGRGALVHRLGVEFELLAFAARSGDVVLGGRARDILRVDPSSGALTRWSIGLSGDVLRLVALGDGTIVAADPSAWVALDASDGTERARHAFAELGSRDLQRGALHPWRDRTHVRVWIEDLDDLDRVTSSDLLVDPITGRPEALAAVEVRRTHLVDGSELVIRTAAGLEKTPPGWILGTSGPRVRAALPDPTDARALIVLDDTSALRRWSADDDRPAAFEATPRVDELIAGAGAQLLTLQRPATVRGWSLDDGSPETRCAVVKRVYREVRAVAGGACIATWKHREDDACLAQLALFARDGTDRLGPDAPLCITAVGIAANGARAVLIGRRHAIPEGVDYREDRERMFVMDLETGAIEDRPTEWRFVDRVIVSADGRLALIMRKAYSALVSLTDGSVTAVPPSRLVGSVLFRDDVLTCDGLLVRLGRDGAVWLDPRDGAVRGRVSGFGSAELRTSYYGVTDDGELALFGSKDGLARVGRRDGVLRLERAVHTGVVTAMALSPDRTRVATGGSDCVISLWALGDGACLGRWQGAEPIAKLQWPRADRLAAIDAQGALMLIAVGA